MWRYIVNKRRAVKAFDIQTDYITVNDAGNELFEKKETVPDDNDYRNGTRSVASESRQDFNMMNDDKWHLIAENMITLIKDNVAVTDNQIFDIKVTKNVKRTEFCSQSSFIKKFVPCVCLMMSLRQETNLYWGGL